MAALILSRAPLRRTLLITSLIVASHAHAAWFDATAGLPYIETVDTKSVNPNDEKWTVIQDRYGRLFTSDDQVHMFDGQSWQTLAVPDTIAVRTLVFDHEHRLWVGGFNEIGYFEEVSLGEFRYHSATDRLPPQTREFGQIWASAATDQTVTFVGSHTVLRWDGHAFQTWAFSGDARIIPLKFENELWLHHLETGLHRITTAGPVLEIPASELPPHLIYGLARDSTSLLVASSQGLFRRGSPSQPAFTTALNAQISTANLTSFAALPNNHYALGTLNDGLLIVSPQGEVRQLTEGIHGLPARTVLSLEIDEHGRLWGTAPNGIFNIDASGHSTVFDSRNGLESRTVRDVRSIHGKIHAANLAQISRLVTVPENGAHFEPLPIPPQPYHRIEPHRDGLLAARFGSLDLITPSRVIPVWENPNKSVTQALVSDRLPDEILVIGTHILAKSHSSADGTYTAHPLAQLPDGAKSFHEEASGRIWISTPNRGIFHFDPATRQLTPFVPNPGIQKGYEGTSLVIGIEQGSLLFLSDRVYQATADGLPPRLLADIPALEAKAARATADGRTVYVVFTRKGATGVPIQGIGELALSAENRIQWREFDLEPFRSARTISALEITHEADRDILWASGSGGIVRVDLATLTPPRPPNQPLIRFLSPDATRSNASNAEIQQKSQHIHIAAFPRDFRGGQRWLYQSRFAEEEWSAPSRRNRFEFTNLSEGLHRFQVRMITPVGIPGAAADYTVRILPPWYRSAWAYGSYILIAIAAAAGIIRIRERRSRARTAELENLVRVRTQELERASAAKDEFLATLSHEIRNPMNGVIGIAESFPIANLDDESRHKFGLLRQCAGHLSSLLEEVLDFSRGQAGIIDLELQPFDLYELVDSVVAITESESARRNIPVEAAISPGVPRRIVGDPRRIRQILLNFVGNALKFAGHGKIEITVWCKSLGTERTELFFAVMDDGPGIAREEQEKIFLRFERGENAQKKRMPGAGLGLSHSKALAEKMGGRIWLESEPGRGACFYFAATFAIAGVHRPASPITLETSRFPLPTALVVDDEEYNRVALAELLRGFGFSVDCVADGPSALKSSEQHAYGVIFLDYQLQGISGAEVARAVRSSRGKSARSPIVATTAFTTTEKRAECLAAGMNTFLGKPVTAHRLRIALAILLNPEANLPPSSLASAGVPDPLKTLRLIAAKQACTLDAQIERFLSELMVEHDNLVTAIHENDILRTCLYAHHLYGRCGFVDARSLETILRKLEAAAATSDWVTVQELADELPDELNRLRLTIYRAQHVTVPPV